MYTFNYPQELWDELNMNKRVMLELITKHSNMVGRLSKNKAYYDGNHDIESRQRVCNSPNSKTVCNHAKDIADTATGYFMGSAISYNNTGDGDMSRLLEAFDAAEVDDTDNDLALDMSVYGVAYEYDYVKQDETTILTKCLSPEHTFIVKDDTIEENVLCGVYYWYKKDDTKSVGTWVATVATENYIYVLNIENDPRIAQITTEEPTQHFFGIVPIIEYKNNKECIGDFEQQTGLIDAYNTLMSDRINDKEQFIDAVLVLYGTILADDDEIDDSGENSVDKAAQKLRKLKLLELPEGTKAEYLTRTFDESGVEILRKAIKEDIYTFSHVPNLTDENFVGNSSGVAMEYKLLGLEMITKIKERYYKKALRSRFKAFANYLGLKQILIDANSIVPVFTRGLPKNLSEISQMISNLKGTVSQRTLLSLLPFVEDPDDELEKVDEENEKSVERQQKLFGNEPNNPPPDEDSKESDVDE